MLRWWSTVSREAAERPHPAAVFLPLMIDTDQEIITFQIHVRPV